jgi:hypothetical protein
MRIAQCLECDRAQPPTGTAPLYDKPGSDAIAIFAMLARGCRLLGIACGLLRAALARRAEGGSTWTHPHRRVDKDLVHGLDFEASWVRRDGGIDMDASTWTQ